MKAIYNFPAGVKVSPVSRAKSEQDGLALAAKIGERYAPIAVEPKPEPDALPPKD